MGGGKSPRVPVPEETAPIPSRDKVKEPVSQAIRDAGAKRLRAARGHTGNIKTPLVDEVAGISSLGKIFT